MKSDGKVFVPKPGAYSSGCYTPPTNESSEGGDRFGYRVKVSDGAGGINAPVSFPLR